MKNLKLILIALLFLAAGCGKDGDPGPQGPQGEQGEQGPKGDKGDPGTANVMYSGWFTPSWSKENSPDYKEDVITVDELTADFTDNGGVVLVYAKATYIDSEVEKTSILPLPSTSGEFYAGFRIDVPGNLVITLASVGDALSLPEPLAGAEFRYILIPGGVSLSSGRKAGIDFSNYQEVKTYFNLAD